MPAVESSAPLGSGVVEHDLPLIEIESVAEPPAARRRRRPDIGFWLAAAWMIMIILLALLAPVLPLQDASALSGDKSEVPSWDHWLGTDNLSRDQLARVAEGARISLTVGFVSAAIAAVFGTLFGLVAGYRRRATETLIMGSMDILLAVPGLIFVIALTSLLGAGVRNVIIAISVLAIPAFARVARAQTLAYAERDFVKAARSLGATRRRILFREIAPNLLPTIAAYALVTVSAAIVVEASLSFIGAGIPPEQPTWGSMIAGGRTFLRVSPHISLIPGLVLFFTVLSLNALGEKLQRRHDARMGLVS
jgi:peptide/nickel transport system permease protein